ncbi:MAG: hypothetical protein N3F05_00540 [Candidatus Diapherotrites archaeon]|nr:hypothetical protein [Candidatus Diapherotrites archaeon]
MESTDWIISSVIFVFLIVGLFFAIPWLMSINAPTITETEMQNIMNNIANKIEAKAILLKTDCNSQRYDCNRQFPVLLDVNTDYNYLVSRPFDQYLNRLFFVIPTGEIHSVYVLPKGLIEPMYDENTSLKAEALITGKYRVLNPYFDINVSNTFASVHFIDSNSPDIVIRYPDMNMSLLKNSDRLIIIGDPDRNFSFIFFPNTNEFWIDMPTDIQINIQSSATNWQIGDSIGVLSSAEWWDYNKDDDYWWHYRIPIAVNTLSCDLTNAILQKTIDLNEIMQKLNISAELDKNSFRLIEYENFSPVDYDPDTNEVEPIPFHVSYSETSKKAIIKWQMPGTVPANSTKLYYLYFDFLPYRKDRPAYANLNYTEPECQLSIVSGDAESTNVTTYLGSASQAFIFNPKTVQFSIKNIEEKEWLSANVSYRLPLAFNAGKTSRQDTNVLLDINFDAEFLSVGCKNCDLNLESLALIEVSSLGSGAPVSLLVKGIDWDLNYNQQTKLSTIWFLVKGSTSANKSRYYFLYYNNLKE